MTRNPLDLDTLVPPDVRAAVEALDPAPSEAVNPVLDRRARDDLARIVSTPPVSSRPGRARSRRTRRLVLTGAAATVLGLAVTTGAVDLHWPPGVHVPAGNQAYAATPPLLSYTPAGTDAAAVLRDLAARTAKLPDTTGTGRYAYVETRSWNLFTRIDRDRPVRSAVVESRTKTWTADDGAGRMVQRHRVPGHLPDVDDSTYPAGGLGLMWPLRSLPDDDTGLARELGRGHPAENGPAERLVAVNDAYLEMPLPPNVRAAMLRYLAATPDLTLTGRVTDRAGRAGIAVSVDSDHSGLPTRYTLILDPADGRLLDYEETLTERAGALGVRIPSVIGYTVYVDSRYTDSNRD